MSDEHRRLTLGVVIPPSTGPEGGTNFRFGPQVVLGLAVVALGLILTAGNLGWIDARAWLRFYPLAIIAVGIAKVLSSPSRSGRLFGGLICIVGLWISSDELFNMRFRVSEWWPLILVAFGLIILSRSRGRVPDAIPTGTDNVISAFAFWSGVRRRVASTAFRRADLTAIMGGVELDLRPATTPGEAVLDVFAMWGGIEITVPPDWDVANEVVAIMGGVDDKSSGSPGAKNRLVLRGFAIMGGVDIKT